MICLKLWQRFWQLRNNLHLGRWMVWCKMCLILLWWTFCRFWQHMMMMMTMVMMQINITIIIIIIIHHAHHIDEYGEQTGHLKSVYERVKCKMRIEHMVISFVVVMINISSCVQWILKTGDIYNEHIHEDWWVDAKMKMKWWSHCLAMTMKRYTIF